MSVILLVDDHPLYHEGLASAFLRLAPELRIVGAHSAEAGLQLLNECSAIELVLIDLVLPTLDGFTALSIYAEAFPHIPRVLISGKEDGDVVRRARDLGAAGFIPKSLALDQLLAALRNILDGGMHFDLKIGNSAAINDEAAVTAANIGDAMQNQLTLRQLEVLQLLGLGYSNKEISRLLTIADRTVRAHLTELFRALGVSSRAQAILAAQRFGLLAPQ